MIKRFTSTKTYGHEVGLSCCFRQWQADSHCALLHGYALAIELEFGANQLDKRQWVVDFGGLKEVKQYLEHQFDHTLIVAADDPKLKHFVKLAELGVAKVNILPKVGCESFARHVFKYVDAWLMEQDGYKGRVELRRVTVREHGANSASAFSC